MVPSLSKLLFQESQNVQETLEMVKLATWDTCTDFVGDIIQISRFASNCMIPAG